MLFGLQVKGNKYEAFIQAHNILVGSGGEKVAGGTNKPHIHV